MINIDHDTDLKSYICSSLEILGRMDLFQTFSMLSLLYYRPVVLKLMGCSHQLEEKYYWHFKGQVEDTIRKIHFQFCLVKFL